MQQINSITLAKGALLLTLSYFAAWLIGPVFLTESGFAGGLPIWFWASCIVAPLALCVAVSLWLGRSHG
ncbi:MAG: hypothetical protein R3Y10_05965 [Ferrimonas sp.]